MFSFFSTFSVLFGYPFSDPLIRRNTLFLQVFLCVPIGDYVGVFCNTWKIVRKRRELTAMLLAKFSNP